MPRKMKEAITFDDVLLVPNYSQVLPREVDLMTRLTRRIHLNIPLLSAAMDTVTESKLAIALAQSGGMGILHKNLTVERQVKEVRLVKKHESVVVKDPLTVSPKATVFELKALMKKHHFSGMPVVGEKGGLEGIITNRDTRFVSNDSELVENLMTPRDKLITVKEGCAQDQVVELLHKHRIEKILVVDDAFNLCGMITAKDISQSETYPNACKDPSGRLRVGAAVGVGEGARERVSALVEAQVDAVVVDTAHGHSKCVLETVRWIKKAFPQVDVIAGNVATREGADALAEAGSDAVKVGIGPGSICTTRIVAGVGVPQITAINEVAEALEGRDIPIIADGGIRFSGDVSKAIAAGASAVMIGSLFAGTEEAPGELALYQGRSYKTYRGMGSLDAMAQAQGSSDRYFQDASAGVEKLVPEGIEGRVPYKGTVKAIIFQLAGGLRASMGYTGSSNIEALRTKSQFIRITSAGMRESHVHDVIITKEAVNYWVE